jgi:G3E family GTPase
MARDSLIATTGGAIPVTVITGLLGAGETLLDRWLRDFAPGEAAFIVNEVGAVGVDAVPLAIEGVDARVVVQGVGDQTEVDLGQEWADGAPRTSRLVSVSFGLDREQLEVSFAACAAV